MRTVTEISKLAGGRYLVMLDDETSFPLYAKELAVYGIEEDAEVSDRLYAEIIQEVLVRRVRLKAMHLLETQDRTEHQLRSRLTALSYPEELVDEAVSYVKKFHYIDDLRFAVNYMETRREQKSMRQMEQDLMQKGVPRETIREAREQAELPDEEQQVLMWLRKKNYVSGETDRKEADKICRFLLRKGYSYSVIAHVMQMGYDTD